MKVVEPTDMGFLGADTIPTIHLRYLFISAAYSLIQYIAKSIGTPF